MKKLILGLVLGLLLGLSTNAFAAIGDIVSAKFAEFNYVVNGSAKAIDSPVLVYEGTSYVRTTDIANLLNYDVTYKRDSRTIEFTGDEPTVVYVTPDPVTGEIIIPDSGGQVPSTGSPTPAPSATPTPTPVPNYAGYNAAVAVLEASVATANNQLYYNWYTAYHQYQTDAPETYQVTYDIMQFNIAANNAQLALDRQALKFQYNIP